MSDQYSTDKTVYLTLGLMMGTAVGVVAGMLTAPRSGQEMRSAIANRASRAKDQAQDKLQSKGAEVADKLNQTLENSKDVIDKTSARAQRAATKAQDEVNDRRVANS